MTDESGGYIYETQGDRYTLHSLHLSIATGSIENPQVRKETMTYPTQIGKEQRTTSVDKTWLQANKDIASVMER